LQGDSGRKSEVVDNIVPQLKDDFLGKNGTEREAEILTVQQSMEVIPATNQQLAASLLRQSLPKCHPDTFSGDVTIFHPCKNLFKAMICDADISHALLGRLRDAAKFEDKDKKKLQEFDDLCADVDYQIGQLPGLRCLNYVNVIQPILRKLPASLRNKWEKQVVDYALENYDAYPTFHIFPTLVERQARIKNHPNVVIKDVQRNEKKPSFGNPFEEDTVQKGDVEMENIHLMDISLQDKPDKIHRVYALVDEQSNASMITPDLENKLGINSKK
jgi:hypothetical protein